MLWVLIGACFYGLFSEVVPVSCGHSNPQRSFPGLLALTSLILDTMNALGEVSTALAKVEDEIRLLEESLRKAKGIQSQLLEKQTQLKAEEDRRKQEEARRQQQEQAKADTKTAEVQAYEDRIAELKRQIAEAEAAKEAKNTEVVEEEPIEEYVDDDGEYSIEEYYEYEEEEITETEYEELTEEEYQEEMRRIAEAQHQAAQEMIESKNWQQQQQFNDPSAQTHAAAGTNPSARNYAETRAQQQDTLKGANQWSKPGWGQKKNHEVQSYENHVTPSHKHLVDKQDALKQKHKWAKPAWATRLSSDEAPAGVDRNPIQNPLLKKADGSGYTRKVFSKEKLSRSDGKFVAPRSKVPPRLAWIVVDINSKKAGKIVLHLYGLGTDAVVNRFSSLPGMSILRSGNNKPISIEDMDDPKFYITTNSTTRNLDQKKDVYGIVQEGKEIIGAIKAADEHAGIRIRQAHVYPVKKAK